MRVGLVIYGALETLSGGYFYDRKLVEFLRAQGDQVEIISLPWRNYPAHLGDNLHFRLPPGLDILIEDELNHPSLIAANQRKPYPVISLVHHLRCSEERPGWQNAFYRTIERRYLRSVDGFIFNSATTAAEVNRLTRQEKPSILAYPPTDRFGAALSEAEVTRRALKPGPLRIAFLGNVIPRKGLHTLLEAAARLHEPFHLDVIGSLTFDPAYASAMQTKAAGLGLESPVTFHGALETQALAGILQQAHLLAVPSSYEGFGIVYLEGMAFGLPAIGTTAGAAAEIITAGETGFLIAPNDFETLADRLTAAAKNRTLLAKMSVNALRRYKQQPAWEQTAQRIRELLSKAITHGNLW